MCVFNVTLAVTWKREIVWFSTLSLGTVRTRAWKTVTSRAGGSTLGHATVVHCEYCTPHFKNTRPTRWRLKIAPQYLARYAELSTAQEEENNLFAHARSRVEHVNSFTIYSHALFHGQPFIGTFENLHAFIGITDTVHTTAFIIRREKSRQVPGFGWWPHFSPYA